MPRRALPPPPDLRRASARGHRRGQAMLESFLVVLVVSLLLFGLLQVAMVYNAREILHHAAARAARARAVGFNAWMVEKALRIAAIPNSGRMLEPLVAPALPLLDPDRTLGENWDDALDTSRPLPVPERTLVERARIPEYLASENHLRAAYILNYEEWAADAFDVSQASGSASPEGGTVRVTVRQRFPLQMPMHRTFYAPRRDAGGVSRITLAGEAEIVEHYPLYLYDQGW